MQESPGLQDPRPQKAINDIKEIKNTKDITPIFLEASGPEVIPFIPFISFISLKSYISFISFFSFISLYLLYLSYFLRPGVLGS